MKRCFVLSILTILLTGSLLYAQESSLSSIIENRLKQADIQTKHQVLSGALSESFPYSLIFSSQSGDTYPLHKICIIIPQNTEVLLEKELIQFIQNLQKNPPPYYVDVLISANDYSKIPDTEIKSIPAGTATYIENLDTNKYTSVIIVSEGINPKLEESTTISFATKGKASPPSFITKLVDSFKSDGTDFKINTSLLAFERLGMIKTDSVLSYVLNQEIPAIHLTPSKDVLDGIEQFIYSKIPVDNDNWDSQYFFTYIFGRSIIISEQFLVLFILIACGVGLFLICFSFLFGKLAPSRKQELKTTFPMIPIIILLLWISIELGEKITHWIFPNYVMAPVISIIFIILITLGIFLLLSKIRLFFSIPQTTYIYGFLQSIITFVNMLIFSLLDLSLIFFFLAEYLITYISRASKKTISLVLYFIGMIGIFIPLFIVDYNSIITIMDFINNGSLINNIFFAFFLTPFVIHILRILINKNLYKNLKFSNKKNLLIRIGITSGFLLISILGLLLISKIVSVDNYSKHNCLKIIEDNDNNYFSIETESNRLFAKQETKLKLNSDKEIIKYKINISNENLLPIYDANYPYDPMSEKNKVIFNLEDYPPENFVLNFSSSNAYDLTVEVTAYIEKNPNTIIKNSRKVIIEGTN